MGELFAVEEDSVVVVDDDILEVEEIEQETLHHPTIDSRRQLENLLDEKRLRNELDDFLDY